MIRTYVVINNFRAFGFHEIVQREWLLCYWYQVFIWLATRQICQYDDWRAIWQSYHRACYLLCKTFMGWTFTAMNFVNIRHNLFSNYTELKSLFPKHKHAKNIAYHWENIHTLSYYNHQIWSLNYYPLFRVRSWNNGMRCMSFYILMGCDRLLFKYKLHGE